MYTPIRHYALLLLLMLTLSGMHAQSGIEILDANPNVCVGNNFSFTMILGTSPNNIELDGWYDQDGKRLPNQSSVVVVSGVRMYVLYSRNRYGDGSYKDTIRVHGIERPQIILKRADTSACVGRQVVLKCDEVISANKVTWTALGNTYADGSLFTVLPTNTKFKIEATNEACSSWPAQKDFTVIPEPVIDPSSLRLTTPVAKKSCAGCSVDLNTLLSHNADSVRITVSQWRKGSNTLASSIVTPPATGTDTYTAVLSGVLYKSNSCGAAQQPFNNVTVTVNLTKSDCELLSKWNNNNLKELTAQPCQAYKLLVQNPHPSDVLVTENQIVCVSASGTPVTFSGLLDYTTTVYYQFLITPKDFDTIYIQATYTNKCTGAPVIYRDTLYFEPLQVRFEMGSQYCKGDSLELRLYLNSSAIEDMQVDSVRFGKHQKYFHCYDESPRNFNRLYISNDTMHTRHFFDTIRAYVYYTRCGVNKIDTVTSVVTKRPDCYPSILRTDINCYGDTGIFTIIEPRYDRGWIKNAVWTLPTFTQIIDTLSQMRSDPRGKETRVRMVSYENMEIKVEFLYCEGGVDTVIKQSFYTNYKTCPPKVTQDLRECRGGQTRVRFKVENPVGDIIKNIRTYTRPAIALSEYDPMLGFQAKDYFLKFMLMRPVKLFYELDYTQGDRTYHLNDSLSLTLESASGCAPTGKSDAPRYCDSETARLTIAVVNPYDTVVQITWNSIPNSPVSFVSQEELSGIRFYYYDRVVPKDTVFEAYVKVVNHGDTMVDTVKIPILTTQFPHLFKQDTVGVCKESTLNIMQFVNVDFFHANKYDYFGKTPTVKMDPYENERWFKMSGEAKAEFMCKSMNGNPKIIDSILIVKNLDPKIVVHPVNSACIGEQILLNVDFKPSELVTWIKDDTDTLYRRNAHGTLFTDIVTGNAKYTAEVTNACGKVSDFFELTAKPAPKFEMSSDISVCPSALGFFKIMDVLEVETATISWQLNAQTLATGIPNVDIPTDGFAQGRYRVVASAQGKNGCLVRDTAHLTVFARPIVDIMNDLSGYLPYDTSICAAINQPFTLTAGGALTYQWIAPQLSSDNPLSVPQVNASTVFKVEGTDANGCVDTASFYVTIFPDVVLPAIDSICPRANYNYCATVDPQMTYEWIKPDLSIIAGACVNITNMSVLDSGSYTLKRTYLACTDIREQRLVLKPDPKTLIIDHNSPLCEGGELIARGQTSVGAQAWWRLPDGSLVPSDQLSIPNLTHSGAGQYWYVASLNHCSDSVSTLIVVDRHTTPMLTLDKSFYCEGDTLRSTLAPAGNGLQYRLSTPGRSYSSALTSILVPNLQKKDSGRVYLVVTNGACRDSIDQNLEVRTRPSVSVLTKPFYCAGDSLRLTVQGALSGTIDWRGPNGFNSNSASVYIDRLRRQDSGHYQVRVTADGCQSLPATAVVHVRPLPLGGLDELYVLCTGDELAWDISQALHTYLWNDGINLGQRQITAGGTYWVKITLNGCSIIDTTDVEERPKPIFELPNDTIVCVGEPFVIQGPQIDQATYLWNTGDQLSEITVDKPGVYTLVIDLNHCTWQDSMRMQNKFCEQLNMPSAFKPGSMVGNDQFRPITKADPSTLMYEMSVFDRFGKRVFYTTDLQQGWDGTYQGKALPAGVYVYRIKATELLFMTDLSTHGTITLIR